MRVKSKQEEVSIRMTKVIESKKKLDTESKKV